MQRGAVAALLAGGGQLQATVGMAVPTASASNASNETRATLPTVMARSRGANSPGAGATGQAGAAVAVTAGPPYEATTPGSDGCRYGVDAVARPAAPRP